MSVNVPLIIRDGVEADIDLCMALDHSYTSDYVWQVQIERDDPHYYQMTFRTERLPRTLEASYLASAERLKLALPDDHCFLVAAERDGAGILGYCVMSQQQTHRVAIVHDLVIERAYRRSRIGSKLLNIARRWGREKHLQRLLVEVNTRNHPAIVFCQSSGLTFCGYNERYFDQQEIAIFFGQNLR
jgi:GNAT superfamily N-acetyltransferase